MGTERTDLPTKTKEQAMPFKSENINSAIIAIQYDLRGFYHPLGFRMKKEDCTPKLFMSIPINLVAFAIGLGGQPRYATDDSYVSWGAPFEQYLKMCQRFAEDCNPAQKEAVQIILAEIKSQAEEMRQKATSDYQLFIHRSFLGEDSDYAKVMKALTQAFG